MTPKFRSLYLQSLSVSVSVSLSLSVSVSVSLSLSLSDELSPAVLDGLVLLAIDLGKKKKHYLLSAEDIRTCSLFQSYVGDVCPF